MSQENVEGDRRGDVRVRSVCTPEYVRAFTSSSSGCACCVSCGRHTFASLMIAARVNAKALSTFMGHANISITLDRYGHPMPGSEEEAAGLLDAYLTAQRERAEEAARGVGGVGQERAWANA
jgi:hypothetical protein